MPIDLVASRATSDPPHCELMFRARRRLLPLATTAVAAAAEIIKKEAGLAPLDNWLAHNFRRSPARP